MKSNESSNETKSVGNRAFKAGIWYTISTIMIKAIAVITTPIVTRMMSADDYGVAATFTSWYSLLQVICTLDLSMSVGRAKLDYPGKLNKFIGSMQLLSAFFTTCMIVLGIIFIEPLSSFMEMNKMLLTILAVYLLLTPAVTFAQTRFRYEYRYKENIFIMLYTSVTSILLTIILLYTMTDNKYIGKVVGTALPTCLLAVFFWIGSIKRKEVSINKEYWKYGLAISLPMLIHTVSLNLLATSDRVVITKFCGSGSTAIYTLAYQYAILMNIVMNAINQAWLPWFHDNYYEGNMELIRKKTKNLVMLGGFIGIGCISLAPEAIRILGPAEYKDGVYVVAPVVIGIVCQFIYSNYINIELHLKNTKYASVGTVIAAILNVVLNIIFVPKYGYIAAAYTTLFSYILLMLLHYLITRYILHIQLYDNVYFVLCLVVVTIMAVVFTYLYSHFVIRFAIMCVIGILFIIANVRNGVIKYKKIS